MSWVKAAPLSRLAEKPAVIKHPPRQISVFKVDDRVFAIDNRCPHEGYPLAAGTVDADCVLTCNWHNWKFRLEDGQCLVGGDHVRSYPTRVEDGYAWVDVTSPPIEELRAEVLRGLRTAFDDRDSGRICREIARLHYQKIDPLDAVREALRWAHDRFEYGTRHSMAAAADWLVLADEFGSDLEPRLVCLAEAVDHLAWDALRHGEYPFPDRSEPFEASRFVAAIEAEQVVDAEAMVVGGLGAGLHWADMEEAFATAALAHYNSFGHSIIYVSKTPSLLDALGPEVEPYVLLPLVRHLANATREDLIPEFKQYRPVLEGLTETGVSDNGSDLRVPFPISTRGALAWVNENISGHTPLRMYDALLRGLAESMLCFDTSYGFASDRPVSQNISWLDFTHGITFSNAIRAMCGKYPGLWPEGLLQMACFLGRNFDFLDKEILDKGVKAEDWRVTNTGTFFDGVFDELMDHGPRDPIFSAHLLKTSIAVRTELTQASPETGDLLLASLNRFLNSPLKTKHVRRLARQAIALVARDFEGD